MSSKVVEQVVAGTGTAGAGSPVKSRGKAKLPELPPAEWRAYPVLIESKFGDLVEKRVRIKDEIEFRTAALKEIDTEIQALMMISDTEKVTWEDRPVSIVHSSSGAKIVAEKLLLAGVPPRTIAECTDPGTEYQYVLVGKVKKEKG